MIPTLEQQVDALWLALSHAEYWVSVNITGVEDGPTKYGMWLRRNRGGNEVGNAIKTFSGPTREDVIAQLIAFQVAERLA